MATYVKYQCSICRRTKDILRDTTRVIPNYCTITKGCAGRLFPIGEFSYQTTTPSVGGLDDWYPRGESRIVAAAETDESDVSLSCSRDSSVVLSLLLSPAEKDSIGSNVSVTFSQRKTENIAYVQHNYKIRLDNQVLQSFSEFPHVAIQHTELSGRDAAGVNMRFDTHAINEGRVFVRVNGVSRFQGTQPDEITLIENRVIFNSLLAETSTVTVTVFQEKDAIERVIAFNRNDSIVGTDINAWSNVVYAENGIADLNDDSRPRWWFYTASSNQLSSLVSGSRLRLMGISGISSSAFSEKARFMLAKPPYSFTDRYLNFYVGCDVVHSAFSISVISEGSNKVLYVIPTAVKEIFPPIKLLNSAYPANSTIGSSFINNALEAVTTTSAAIIDDAQQRQYRNSFKSAKIIGPIL